MLAVEWYAEIHIWLNMNRFIVLSFQDCLGHAHVLLAAFERVCIYIYVYI